MIVVPLVLTGRCCYRPTSPVARFDEDRVRAELAPDIRVLVAPYTGEFKPGNNYASSQEHCEQVGERLDQWADDNRLKVVRVEGPALWSSGGVGEPGSTRGSTGWPGRCCTPAPPPS